ncbi:MAG: hypothetical protein GX654_07185 [Desulfatiglans sp.]|jgi:hypothetical protein|nr:hypothetical protein [Desulfatiglans sp.]
MGKAKKTLLKSLTGVILLFSIALLYADALAAKSERKAEAISFEVLNPEAEMIMASDISVISPRVKNLSAGKIGLVWAGKSGGEFFLDALEILLKKKYPSATILRYTRGADNAEARIPKEVDTFVYAVGDSGQGAWDSVSYTIKMEKLGKPGVAVFGEHLMHNAETAANHLGMPSVRMAPLPSMEFYPNRASAKSMIPCAEMVFNDIVNALTLPIKPSEKEAGIKPGKAAIETVKISADSLESAYEKFYQTYMDNNWGDGLPLVPPTPGNVAQMLKATSLAPDKVLGVIKSPDGTSVIANVTVQKAAVNAVMAGARPEYFPVIVAAMEGISDKDFSHHVFSSDGSFNLFIGVSGPIVDKINMHTGIGLLGHGWRANNTIGRAVRLCMNNIGHLKPAKLDTALTGRPSSHTFYVLAENNRLSPWAPYHTGRGYKAEESYVTVSGIGLGGDFTGYGGGTGGAWTVDGMLDDIIGKIAPNRLMFASYLPGVGLGAFARPFNYIFILSPDTANALKKRDFTREGLVDYIIDKTSVPYEELTENEIKGLKKRLSEKSEAFGGTDNIPEERIPMYWENLKPGGKVPVVVSPDTINIFVSGEVSGYNFGAIYLLGAHSIKPVQ